MLLDESCELRYDLHTALTVMDYGGVHLMDFAHRSFELRPACGEDFGFAWSLYRDLMKPLTVELVEWNEPGQKSVVELALTQTGTSIITVGGLDAGWLQVAELPDSIYLGQLYLAPSLQNQGIGTAILTELKNKARQSGRALALDVMKNNRSRLLYERLGFQVIEKSEYKLKMRWQQNSPESEREPSRIPNASNFTGGYC